MNAPLADAEAAIRAGNPKAALVALTHAVKAAPAKAELRIFMAQLLCVMGQWERAHTQLNVVADMDETTEAPGRWSSSIGGALELLERIAVRLRICLRVDDVERIPRLCCSYVRRCSAT